MAWEKYFDSFSPDRLLYVFEGAVFFISGG
jgi:hypothetical protein